MDLKSLRILLAELEKSDRTKYSGILNSLETLLGELETNTRGQEINQDFAAALQTVRDAQNGDVKRHFLIIEIDRLIQQIEA